MLRVKWPPEVDAMTSDEHSGDPPETPGRGAPSPAGADILLPMAAVVLVMLTVLALRELASLIVPVVFGLFLALVAWPMIPGLQRRGIRHPVALAGAILVVLVVVLGSAAIAAYSVAELVLQIPRYEARLRDQVQVVLDVLAGLGIEPDMDTITEVISPEQLLAFVRPVASALSSAGLAILVLAVTMIYALVGGSSLQQRARDALGDRHGVILGMEQFGIDLRRYLLVRAVLGLFAAVLSLVLLLVLGVPFAILWAFLVFAASFIPNIGAFVAVIPPAILAFLTGGVVPAVIVLIGYTLINLAQDQFLQPVIMGSELNLSPLVVFLSVLVWAWILGAAGALLAVPLTVGLVAILEAFPSSRSIAVLLRNKAQPPPGDAPVPEPEAAPPAVDAAAGDAPAATLAEHSSTVNPGDQARGEG
jgi:predicted PurR-regulated permease PerM